MAEPLYGGIEAGGTKFVCAVGTGPDDVRDEIRFPTADPEPTLRKAIEFFRNQKHGALSAVGISCFGPVDPDPGSPTFGYITTTPKKPWVHTDFAGPIRRALAVPVGFDTDVNGAALGEWRWGAGRSLNTIIYLTVGTGIGGGVLIDGRPHHGMIHPEMGHVRIPHDLARDPFPGKCPFHGDCLEGLASGPAIEARVGRKGSEILSSDPVWDLIAEYLAYALANYIVILSPQRLILGGGVMDQAQLFPKIRERVARMLNGYIQSPAILDRIDSFIVPPGLGGRAGVLGAFALAEEALHRDA
ncbi:MAG TPA: ROK family protein [Spirochaetia bacterium]|nr:ROK family protein [Spirochaetia bacterium]